MSTSSTRQIYLHATRMPPRFAMAQSSFPLPHKITEFADSAATALPHPPSVLTPLQNDAGVEWTADTGATSHMTPHRHWMRNYTPISIPIRLADHFVVYAAGPGLELSSLHLPGREKLFVLSSFRGSCTSPSSGTTSSLSSTLP